MGLTVESIHKRYGAQEVLKGINLSLQKGETLSVLGASGCGKTTLLKCIAGLEQPDAGTVAFDGQPLHTLATEERNIVYLSQEPSLFDHLSAAENIGFGLALKRRRGDVSASERTERVNEMLEALDLTDHRSKRPPALSGGQKQRVAFGRALILRPKVVLLDEPFGSLDAGTREEMQQLYKRLAADYGITALFITHDVKEALLTGDRFGYMQDGKLDLFTNLEAFRADPRSGVARETDFWTKLK
jgi:putrescine transport system ATP-binding protein